MIALPPEAKKDVAAQAIRTLSFEDREDLAERVLPTQGIADRIWQIIVWAFALVFVLSALALFAAAFWNPDQIQILLTVVTTVAGVLAGFISGRASSGGSGRQGSGGNST